MDATRSTETNSGANEYCIGRMVNKKVGATPELRAAKARVKELIESLPGDCVVFRRDIGRVAANAGPLGRAIELILELSAEAQIRRREFAKESPAFHSLTGAIVTYGKVLALLSKLQERHCSGIGRYDLTDRFEASESRSNLARARRRLRMLTPF
jgi:hypothetical protein